MASVAVLLGQNATEIFNQGPPEVEKALRARVAQYYQAFVDGKFRQAVAVVAEDSQEAFFAIEKHRIRGFEIIKINYSENFTKATVVATIDTDVSFRGTTFPAKAPLTTQWKIEDGEWFWCVIPSAGAPSPMGMMKAGPGGQGLAGGPFSIPKAEQILEKVKVDKSEVALSSYEPASGSVTLANGLAGPVTLRVQVDKVAGLEAKIDKPELPPNEIATITFSYVPPDKSPKSTLIAKIMVEPTRQEFPIKLVFRIPPDVERAIPKR
jgi:hypothetical protein